MAIRSTNTFIEALQQLHQDVAQAKMVADADMPFLIQVETMILNRMKQPIQSMQDGGQLPQDGAPTAGGMPPGMNPGVPSGIGPGTGGPMAAGAGRGAMPSAAPNFDELRRMLSQG